MHIDFFFFFNDTATTEIYTLSLHDALPISLGGPVAAVRRACRAARRRGRRGSARRGLPLADVLDGVEARRGRVHRRRGKPEQDLLVGDGPAAAHDGVAAAGRESAAGGFGARRR